MFQVTNTENKTGKEEDKIKKVILLLVLFVMLVCAYVLGAANIKVVTDVEAKENAYCIDMESVEFQENYIDMQRVVDFSATDTGIMLHLDDDTGYYWEK